MAVYLIDYENVNAAGLVGVDKLSRYDEVYIMTSLNAPTISLATLPSLLASPAKINVEILKVGHANALDFKLLTKLFLHINKRRKYFIISKDGGFKEAIDYAKSQGYDNISMCSSINAALGADEPVAVVTKMTPVLFEQLEKECSKVNMTLELYERLRKVAKPTKSLQAYYLACTRTFGQEKGHDIYIETRKLWKELRA